MAELLAGGVSFLAVRIVVSAFRRPLGWAATVLLLATMAGILTPATLSRLVVMVIV